MKLAGLGEVTYLSTRRKEDGVTDYEEEFSSFLEQEDGELVWSLTITRVESSMAGFYQCEVQISRCIYLLELVIKSLVLYEWFFI